MKVKNIKSKVAAKIAKGKAKVARKCGKAAKACTVVLCGGVLATGLSGCQGLTSPSRSQTLTIHDSTINIYGSGNGPTNDVARVEIASQAMQIETGGSETQTATPTQTTDVKPDIDVNLTKGGGAANAASSLVGAAADALCAGGNCTDGGCADGSCTDR